MRLRIGYLPDCLPSAVPVALRHLSAAAPKVRVELQSGPARRLIDDLRARRLDAVIASLPGPTRGLRITPLGRQQAIAALPATASQAQLVLDWVTCEQLVVLPREANPAFHDAVVSMCHSAGFSPSFTEVATVDEALLAVAAGGGIALVPESAADRFTEPGIRFLPIEAAEPAFESAVLTDPEAENLAVPAFLRSLSRTVEPGPAKLRRPRAPVPAA